MRRGLSIFLVSWWVCLATSTFAADVNSLDKEGMESLIEVALVANGYEEQVQAVELRRTRNPLLVGANVTHNIDRLASWAWGSERLVGVFKHIDISLEDETVGCVALIGTSRGLEKGEYFVSLSWCNSDEIGAFAGIVNPEQGSFQPAGLELGVGI